MAGEESSPLGPPALNLALVPPRARIPTTEALTRAMDALAADRYADSDPIMPGGVTRTVVGQRVGTIGHAVDTVLMSRDPGAGRALDASAEDAGQPATVLPVLFRQLRAPRAPALPRIDDLALRRRTFVSEADRVGGAVGKALRHFLLAPTAASVMRREVVPSEATRLLVSVADPSIGRSLATTGRLRLVADVCKAAAVPEDVALMEALSAFGLLQKEEEEEKATTLSARLRIGAALHEFATLDIGKPGAGLIALDLILPEAVGVRDALRATIDAADADSGVVLLLGLGTPGHVAAFGAAEQTGIELQRIDADAPSLVKGPPEVLAIPLMLRDERRAAKSVALRTLAFGDPAYDRRLSSRAETGAQRFAKASPGTYLWWLALDRAEYDPATPVHFAFGLKDAARGAFVSEVRITKDTGEVTVEPITGFAEVTFTLRPYRRPGQSARDAKLRLVGEPTRMEPGPPGQDEPPTCFYKIQLSE
ncbi:MAG: hypothetical protein AAFZ09_11965, partial [Pseudomonadota bacterium]